jgi:ATP-dependent protease ClpP protease subunit
LALIALLAMQTRDQLLTIFAGVGTLDARVVAEEDTLLLNWHGTVDAPMAERIADAFAKNKSRASKVVLSLSSPGGALDHGAKVVRLLRDIRRTHTLETVIEGRRICASMCVPVYLQGEQRLASPNARFMFHEVSFRESLSDEALPVPAAATQRATDSVFRRYFDTAGVPERWIRAVRQDMTGGRDVWKSARELMTEKAGIVQRLLE